MAYYISVYAIAKNEEQFINRWYNSVKEADEVVVLDTGSTDNTVKLLKDAGAKVYIGILDPFRFDKARNTSLSYVFNKSDICVSMDLDEVLDKGWSERLKKAWTDDCDRLRYSFACSHNSDGSVLKKHSMEKIHRRHDYKWVYPVHERLEYTGLNKEKIITLEDFTVHHFPDHNKPRTQYLSLLELSHKENPTESSIAFWLGREYLFSGMYIKCINTLNKHLNLPSAQWKEERSASLRFIADAYSKLNDDEKAKSYYLKAVSECNYIREPYLSLSSYAYHKSNWKLCLWACTEGLKIVNRTYSYLNDELAWSYGLYDLAAIACYHIKDYKNAKYYIDKALDLEPLNKRLIENRRIIEEGFIY